MIEKPRLGLPVEKLPPVIAMLHRRGSWRTFSVSRLSGRSESGCGWANTIQLNPHLLLTFLASPSTTMVMPVGCLHSMAMI